MKLHEYLGNIYAINHCPTKYSLINAVDCFVDHTQNEVFQVLGVYV